MKLTIVNPKGTYFDGDVEYIIVDGDNGQMGILENHSPVVIGCEMGFLKRVTGDSEYYYMLAGAIIEYSENIANVITQEIAEGKTLDEAQAKFEQIRTKAIEENKKRLIDFTELERDLAKNMRQIKGREFKK